MSKIYVFLNEPARKHIYFYFEITSFMHLHKVLCYREVFMVRNIECYVFYVDNIQKHASSRIFFLQGKQGKIEY